MKFVMLLKSDKNSEAGVMPSQEILVAMGKYHEELIKAGVLLEAEGLYPSSKGARVRLAGSRTTVVDGPFADTGELIGGFWMLQVRSLAEAIEWAKRVPIDPKALSNSSASPREIELRQVIDVTDFSSDVYPSREAENTLEKEREVRMRTNT